MKFLCIRCDSVMTLTERALPGDGTLAAVFACTECGNEVAMLTNPMETQLVSSLGVKIGGRTVPAQPMEQTRTSLDAGRNDAFDPPRDAERRVNWDADAIERLGRVPAFVRGMVKRIYADYAKERGIHVITPDMMDRARSELGLEGM